MARLTIKAIREATRPGRYGDGGTLYLNVAPGGTKSWVQRITIDGKQRDIGLGPWPVVTLAEARDLAIDNRRAVRRGVDPLADKHRAKVPTFLEAAQRTFEANRARWRNAKVAANWLQQLERHAFPKLGHRRVDAIDREAVLSVLTPIWTVKPEAARKVRQRISATLRWAEAHGFIDHNPAGEAINGALPAQPSVREHLRALPYHEVGAALATIDESAASVAAKLCLRFLVLTAARSGEARGATWSEIDMEACEWRIPGSRMKAGQDHRVPLSDAVLAVLDRARDLRDGSDLIFPSPRRPGQELSDMTLTKVLRTTGFAERATVHGFRSSFRDWAAEKTSAPHAVMELALAHAVGSKVEQAYARSDLLARRRDLMQRWSDYLIDSTGRRVLQLHG